MAQAPAKKAKKSAKKKQSNASKAVTVRAKRTPAAQRTKQSKTVQKKPTTQVKSAKQKRTTAAPHTALLKLITTALEDLKATRIVILDVRTLTDVTDAMIIACGNSDRHVRAIADKVVEVVKRAGMRPLGVEGTSQSEWVLVDVQDVVVHIMLPRVRELYRLEDLWDIRAVQRTAAR